MPVTYPGRITSGSITTSNWSPFLAVAMKLTDWGHSYCPRTLIVSIRSMASELAVFLTGGISSPYLNNANLASWISCKLYVNVETLIRPETWTVLNSSLGGLVGLLVILVGVGAEDLHGRPGLGLLQNLEYLFVAESACSHGF